MIGAVFVFVAMAVVGCVVFVAIAANTRALREEKEIRAALDQLQRYADSLPPDASLEQFAALNARIEELAYRLGAFQRSPFTVGRKR